MGDYWPCADVRRLLRPILHIQAADVPKLTHVRRDNGCAKHKGIGGDQQLVRSDRTTCGLQLGPEIWAYGAGSLRSAWQPANSNGSADTSCTARLARRSSTAAMQAYQ